MAVDDGCVCQTCAPEGGDEDDKEEVWDELFEFDEEDDDSNWEKNLL